MLEVLKRWRKIIIAHDLSRIDPKDFLYVLKNRSVVERGSRCDLEAKCEYAHDGEGIGDSREMLEAQRTGGFRPGKPPSNHPSPLPSSEETVHALLSSDSNDQDADDDPSRCSTSRST